MPPRLASWPVGQLAATLQQQIAQGDVEGAATSLTEFAELFAKVAGPNHPQVIEARLLVIPQLLSTGRNDDALIAAKKVLEQMQRQSPVDRRLRAIAHDRLGMVYQAMGRDDQAKSSHTQAVEELAALSIADRSLAARDATNNNPVYLDC